MKNKIFVLLLAAVTYQITPALAQQPAYETIVDGVKVIVQPSGNGIVEIQTVFKGGVMNYPDAKQGIESLAMTALTECGTVRYDKNSFKNQLDKVSAQMWSTSYKDYSVLRMNCIKTDFDAVWPLYVEALKMPVFNATEFARIRQDAVNFLKANESSPDQAIEKYATKIAFAGRDYAKDPEGTVATLQSITPEEAKAYYQSIFTKSHLTIVIVADIERQEIERKVRALLNGVKSGSPVKMNKEFFRPYKNTFSSESRDLATNYIEGITSGPLPGTPDYDAYFIAMRIFADKHFLDIRTNNGLSYAPFSTFSNGTTSVAKFGASTTDPNKYINVFYKLVDKVKHDGFTADEVKNMKVTYLTRFYAKQETNYAQASSLVSNEVIHNNWHRSLTMVDDVKNLTPADVSDAFRKYIGNIVWVYQGDPKKVNAMLYTNGIVAPDNPVVH